MAKGISAALWRGAATMMREIHVPFGWIYDQMALKLPHSTMISVAIVDDEKDLRESIATFINGSPGFRCVSAYGNAEAALLGIPTDKPDVVLMDINLGRMNGIECVERLKTNMPD